MKLAALSDIHGNARALDAVLADIASRGITDIVNLGDCAYGPFDPRQVMNRLLQLSIPTVSGNEDRILVETTEGIPHSRMAMFCANMLERPHIEWLGDLPTTRHVRETFLFHGHPERDMRYLLTIVEKSGPRPRTPSEIDQILAGCNHPLILCGHDHTPRVVRLIDERMIVNPGSVGCPAYTDDVPYEHSIESGSPHARYAVIEIHGKEIAAELISVSYDWEAAADEATANGFPDWAVWLRTGRT